MGSEEVSGKLTLLGAIEDITLDTDIGLCEDIEEENPVLGVEKVPPPEMLVGVDDTVCVVDIVPEVSDDPNELYKEDDDGDTVGTRGEEDPAELKPELIDATVLDDNPGLLVLVL